MQIEGVLIREIVDTGSDITILNRDAFQGIATACGLKRDSLSRLIEQHSPMATNP